MVEELQIRRRATRRLLKFSTGRIREIEIPLPSIEEQRWAVAELEAVQSRVRDFQLLQESSYLELQALMPAVLDQAFRGKL
jgi:type I restriction enzyme S subunit